MIRPEDPKLEIESEDPPASVSRTRRRQDARAVSLLGLELIALSPSVLDRLDLPSELREAIALCQRLKLRARSRQKRLIAQLLRAEDHDAIRGRIGTYGVVRFRDIAREKQNELWCARLIAEGDPALQDFMETYPDADRQQIRTFVRGAQQDPAEKKTQRAQRGLLRVIRAVRV